MMARNKAQITEIIFAAIDEINRMLPQERRLRKSEDTVLSGDSGGLDSLGLINLIVATEQKIQETFNISVALADEKAMTQDVNPFSNVGTISDYIAKILQEKSRE